MAYNKQALMRLSGFRPGVMAWSYKHTDTAEAISAAGYVTDAEFNGLLDGDLVVAVDTSNAMPSLMGVSVASDGAATLSSIPLAAIDAVVPPMIEAATLRPRGTIRHVRSGGFFVDVIRVVNPLPTTVRCQVHPDMDVGTGESERLSCREFARTNRLPAVINANSFRNADGTAGYSNPLIVPNSFLISDGTVYASWASGTNLDRIEGFTVQSDGTMKRRARSDVGDAAGYVEDGALWGFAWGAWLIEDGVDVSEAGEAWMNTEALSARSIFGRAENGDWIIIQVQGVTGSQGPIYGELVAIAQEHECHDAFLYEGGGSAQVWWDHYYAHPSSDNDWADERTLQSFITIDCPLEEYDTGYIQLPLLEGYTARSDVGVRVRQIGAQVSVEVAIDAAEDFPDSATDVTADVTDQFRRFLPQGGNVVARMFLMGSGPAGGSMFTGNAISLRTISGTSAYLAGCATWTAKHGV